MVKGIIFPNQHVTAAGHGAIFNAALLDGILTGCSMSYSGASFHISEGFFILCGRSLQVVGTETIEVTQNAGYARIKAVIDNSKVATAEEFEQYETVVEYASAISDFSALTQQDLNMSDTAIYEAELAVLSLGTDGITDVVRSIGNAAGVQSLTAIVSASEWTQYENYATKTMTVPGLISGDAPIVDINLTGTSGSELISLVEAWANIIRVGVDSSGNFYIYSTEIPTVDLPIKILCVRK